MMMKTKEARTKEVESVKSDRAEEEAPTPEEVILSIEKSFEENIKPIWAEWDREVRVIRFGRSTR